ncbi:MAG: hypothetical protein Kow00109_09890 [Acidobacteriota bacterium]
MLSPAKMAYGELPKIPKIPEIPVIPKSQACRAFSFRVPGSHRSARVSRVMDPTAETAAFRSEFRIPTSNF